MKLTEAQKAMLCAMQEEIEEQGYKIEKLQSERDQLLEALQRLCSRKTRTSKQIWADWDNARAVVARVEVDAAIDAAVGE